MKWGEPGFSELLVGSYLGLLTLIWGFLVAGAGAWKRKHGLPNLPDQAQQALPKLSILIPARNEALNIEACVLAALASDHPDFEVLVVDDHSTDNTLDHALKAGPQVRGIVGAELPPGWAGKSWACQQAGERATGEHLLFIDADVVVAPDAARKAAGVLAATKVDLLSAFGSWRLESFWERVAIPVIGWFIRGATDVAAVNTAGRPEAFANGQFLLITHEAWTAVGGHAAVKAEVLDDVRLARAVKQQGRSLGLYFAPELFRVRLYRSLGAIVSGYGKNLYEGMDRKPLIALVALAFQAVSLLAPMFGLVLAVVQPDVIFTAMARREFWLLWLGLVVALPYVLRVRLERVEGRSGVWAVTHLLGNLVLAWVLVRALFTVQTEWKGRVFHDGKAAS